jgi:hypothetical protein
VFANVAVEPYRGIAAGPKQFPDEDDRPNGKHDCGEPWPDRQNHLAQPAIRACFKLEFAPTTRHCAVSL